MLPGATRPGLPTVRVARAAGVRVHLAFRTSRITVSVGDKTIAARIDRAGLLVSWRANRAGTLVIETHASAGDASYIGRLLRPRGSDRLNS
jgi:hypothetical protein